MNALRREVARCKPVAMQRATFAKINTTTGATNMQLTDLKAAANGAIARNSQCNIGATAAEKARNFSTQKTLQKLHESTRHFGDESAALVSVELMTEAVSDPDLVRNQYGGYSRRPAAVPPPIPQPTAVVLAALAAACRGLDATPGQLNALLDDTDRADIEVGCDLNAALRDLARGIHDRRLIVFTAGARY